MYTTYQILIDSFEEGVEDLLKSLENITGNRWTYGLNTPIYLRDIPTNALMLTLMDYCAEDTTALKKVICLGMVKPFLQPWIEMTQGDTQLADLIAVSETVLDVIESRRDYCDDPIPGGTASTSELTARIDKIVATYESWDSLVVAEPTYTWIYTGSMRTDADIPDHQKGQWFYIPELATNPYSLSTSYANPPSINIETALASNPAHFVKIFEGLTSPTLYQKVGIYPTGGYTFNNTYLGDAARMMARAVIAAVSGESPLGIYQMLLNSTTKMKHRTSQNIDKNSMRLKEMGSMIMPIPAAPRGSDSYNLEAQVTSAIENQKVALLSDPSYVSSFSSGGVITNYKALFTDLLSKLAVTADAKSLELRQNVNNTEGQDTLSATLRALIV